MIIHKAKNKEQPLIENYDAVEWLEKYPEDIPIARENLAVRKTGYEDDDFRQLIAAVCLQACVDYKKASMGKKIEGFRKPGDVIKDCREFFKSDIFQFFINRISVDEIEKLIRATPEDSLRNIWKNLELNQMPKEE